MEDRHFTLRARRAYAGRAARLACLSAGLLMASCGVAFAAVASATKTAGADVVEATLAGEFALQAGRLDEAVDWYLQAARAAGDDAGLAERATRIGLLATDDARSKAALTLWKARAPRSLPMRAAEATLALRGNDRRAARRELQALLRDPDPRGWRHALTVLGPGARDRALAAEVLGDLVGSGSIPDDLQAWLAFGGLAQQLGDAELAERIVDAVVQRFPGEPRVAILRASQLREAGQAEAAAATLAEVAALAGIPLELRMAIAFEYDQLDDIAAAAAVLASGEQSDRSYALRASLLAKAEDKGALSALYSELERDAGTPDPARRLLLGQVAEFLERHEDALAWYRGVPGGEQRWQARLRADKVLYDLGRVSEAFADLRALQQDAEADDGIRRDAYLLEAELHAQADDAAAEQDAYARGLAAFADEGALLYSRALMWERRDDIARAEADLRRVLVSDPDNVAALNALGYTLADRTTRYREALELIDRARVAEPDNPAIIDSYGWVLYRLGRNDEALVALRRAYGLQEDAEIGAHLGEVLWATGQRAEARRFFDEARKLDADSRALQWALEKTGA